MTRENGVSEVVEDTYYNHDEHGRVKVVKDNGEEVGFLVEGETVIINGKEFQKGGWEDRDNFVSNTEPASMIIEVPAAKLTSEANNPGGQ